jgi:probable addiction module antidote protein
MNTVFIGGSRHISRLPAEVRQRLDNIIHSGHIVIVGDANGADKAVQKHLQEAAYDKVKVFCSGENFRNNIGHWATKKVDAAKSRGFQFYAAKDREMAREADFGLMIWDGKSAGTVLNVLRLVRAGKIAVLFSVPEKRAINIKTEFDWETFLGRCSDDLRRDLRERATPEEWQPGQQAGFLDTIKGGPKDEPQAEERHKIASALSEDEVAASLNAALAAGDPAAVVDTLGNLAKVRGMTNVAKETGLARESLYRALSSDGNPEFATVIKVFASLGFRLVASPIQKSSII